MVSLADGLAPMLRKGSAMNNVEDAPANELDVPTNDRSDDAADDATESDSLRHCVVSDLQTRAVELLLLGKRDADIAVEVGVHRSTVTRWRTEHPGFRAELMARRAEVWDASRERLLGLVGKIVTAIEIQLANGSPRLSELTGLLATLGVPPITVASPKRADALFEDLVDANTKRFTDEVHRHFTPFERMAADGARRSDEWFAVREGIRSFMLGKLVELEEETAGANETGATVLTTHDRSH